MKYVFPLTVAVLLTAFSVQSASAQVSTLTNADVVRLVAMHVSDQTVIAVIHEATATQFELSELAISYLAGSGLSPAVIAAMRQPSTPTPVPRQSPTAGAETLVGASVEAKKIEHSFPLSTNTGPAGRGPVGLEPAPLVPHPETEPAGRWAVALDRSRMDDSLTVTLSLGADAPIKAWLKVVQPSLILRCKERALDTYVAIQTAAAVELGGGHTVRLRFDGEAPNGEDWLESTDHAGLFAPEPEVFLNRLRSTDRLTMEFTPFNAPPVTMSFDTRGLRYHVNRLIDACPLATRVRRR